MIKDVLKLSARDAKTFFLTQEAYSNPKLPEYFLFKKVLNDVAKKFPGKLDNTQLFEAKKFETTNHILYGNKDGKYAWRKFEIINPLIYVSLVNVVVDVPNWKIIKERFRNFQKNKNLECESIPVLPFKNRKQQESQISQWVTNIEKKSLALALDYQYIFHTDITDCYGSIYTHTIPWAIHTKTVAKQKRKFSDLFGNEIDHHLQAMSGGQTNGIPQGSILMDFISEMVLGHADELLTEALKKSLKTKNYHILRYRDDYRIFVNDTSDGEIILKCISEVLIGLGLRLNEHKTHISSDVIGGSLKKDKLEAISLLPIESELSKPQLLRQLLLTQQIGKKFPNSGTLINRLSKVLDHSKPQSYKHQERVIISILVDIAFDSPNTYTHVAALISSCLAGLTKKEKQYFLVKVKQKMCKLPNSGLIEIWTQRIAQGLKIKFQWKEPLCVVAGGRKQKLFATKWILRTDLRRVIDDGIYVDQKQFIKVKPVINKKEVQLFNSYYN